MIFGYKSDGKRECRRVFRREKSITSYKDDLRKMSRIFNHQKSNEMASSKAPLLNFFIAIGYFIPKFYEKTFFLTGRIQKNM